MEELTMTTRYPVPERAHRVEEEIKRSRFIATVDRADTVEAAVAFVDRVSEEFADATHNCWAYVVGPPGSTDRIGMSDAGEPHGTAGRPMLNALLHSGIGDVAVVVTRYYGGTKLGTGGLVRAYTGAVQKVLAAMALAECVDRATVALVVAYPSVDAVRQLFAVFEVEVVSQTFEVEVRFELRLPRSSLETFRAAVLDATRGHASLSIDT